jgi:VIT1/CCC1 family predicted Fe2+/Mn2+ transporter
MAAVVAEHEPELHHAHRDVTGGWLRPATFGVMDGLVSNFALVAGVIAGGASSHQIVLTGLAGLAAGACSMASGEFISVSSQTELTRAEIDIEKRELRNHADEERAELTAIFRAKGLRPELAAEVADELSANPDVAWRVHVREELGVDPDDLPSAWLAAGSSFLAFALGALVPLIPFMVGAANLLPSLLLSVLGLGLAGAVVAGMTARALWFGASRQIAFGALSAAVTYGIGLLVGSVI